MWLDCLVHTDKLPGKCSGHVLQYRLLFSVFMIIFTLELCKQSKVIVGPSGVRALPLAAGINVVAIVLGIIFLSSSSSFFRVPYFSTRKKAARVLHRLLSHTDIRIPIKKTSLGTPPTPRTMTYLAGQGEYFEKLS